jgi:hypothetical protein
MAGCCTCQLWAVERCKLSRRGPAREPMFRVGQQQFYGIPRRKPCTTHRRLCILQSWETFRIASGSPRRSSRLSVVRAFGTACGLKLKSLRLVQFVFLSRLLAVQQAALTATFLSLFHFTDRSRGRTKNEPRPAFASYSSQCFDNARRVPHGNRAGQARRGSPRSKPCRRISCFE